MERDGGVAFDRDLYHGLPQPLARAYRKAYNSPTSRHLHDNALSFALCVLRCLSSFAIAALRDMSAPLREADRPLVEKLAAPSEGHWRDWLVTALPAAAAQEGRRGPLVQSLLDLVARRAEANPPELAAATSALLAQVTGKPVVRTNVTTVDFLEALVRYRNSQAHGAPILDESVNRETGRALLGGVVALARSIPIWATWDLVHVGETVLDGDEVSCELSTLEGPELLRIAPRRYRKGGLVPVRGHVALVPKDPAAAHVDLHPLLVLSNETVLFANGVKGKNAVFLDYDAGGAAVPLPGALADYEELGRVLAARVAGGAAPPPEKRPAVQETRFRYDALLGRGGMGEVHRAFDLVLKRNVAIKRIRPDLPADRGMVRRSLDEARNAARLNHPNVVSILTIDEDERGPFIVMELMEGGTLRERLRRGPLALPEAVAQLRQLLLALAHAHERGIVHRDVKPENVLLTATGIPKLGDFGLALGSGEEPRGGDSRAGTRAYLAPELLSGQATHDWRTDLYALGLTFYEMVTALPPQPVIDEKVPSLVLPTLRKLVHPRPNLRYESLDAAVADARSLERSLELASQDEEQFRARVRRTNDQGFAFLAAGRVVDAQGAFERVLAERPDDDAAATGLLVAALAASDMERAAEKYAVLAARSSGDPRFRRLQAFFESIRPPILLELTPRPAPVGYVARELEQGRVVKELVPWDANHVNLGEVGEVLADLLQARGGRVPRLVRHTREAYDVAFELAEVSVLGRYRVLARKRLFGFAELTGIGLALEISGKPFAAFRLVRYVMHHMTEKLRRPPETWHVPETAQALGIDPAAALAAWRRFSVRFEDFAEERDP